VVRSLGCSPASTSPDCSFSGDAWTDCARLGAFGSRPWGWLTTSVKRVTSGLVIVLTVGGLTACSSDPTGPYDHGVRAALELAAEATTGSLRGQFAEADATTERDLWRLAGVERAVGGASTADEAFGALQRELQDWSGDPLPDPVEFVPAAYVGAGTSSELGAGLFAAWRVDGAALAAAAGHDPADGPGVFFIEQPGGSLELSSQAGLVSVADRVEFSDHGVSTVLETEHTIPLCTPDGVEATSHVELRTTAGDAATWIVIDVTTTSETMRFTAENGSDGPQGNRVITVSYDSTTDLTDVDLGWEPNSSTGEAMAYIDALTAALMAAEVRDAIQTADAAPDRCSALAPVPSVSPPTGETSPSV
jgi:hypothetical protein